MDSFFMRAGQSTRAMQIARLFDVRLLDCQMHLDWSPQNFGDAGIKIVAKNTVLNYDWK